MMFRRHENALYFVQVGGKKLLDDCKACDKVVQRYNKRYGVKKQSSTPWQTVGRVKRTFPYEKGMRFECENGWVEVQWIADDCLRIRLRPQDGDFLPPFSYAVEKVDWFPVPIEIVEQNDVIEMRSPVLICRVGRKSFRVVIENTSRQRLCSDARGMQWQRDGRIRLSTVLHPDETCHGLGERTIGINLRSKQFKLWNTSTLNNNSHSSRSSPHCIPFYLGIHSQGAYGIFWDNPSRGVVDIGSSAPNELVFESESGELRYYIFAGHDIKAILARFTELTGHIQLPPLWALGYHQSRMSYFTQQTVLATAAEFRKRSVPCDVIHLNIHTLDGFRTFTLNQEHFPNFRQMVNDLHVNGFKVIITLNPGVKVDPDYDLYKSGISRDTFLKYPDGQPFTGVSWSGTCHFPDFSNPATRAWWVEQSAQTIKAGVDGVAIDLSEPSIFSTHENNTTPPDYLHHDIDGLGGNHRDSHNIYSLQMARATLEALDKHRPKQRQVNITQAGYAGIQRYATAWTSASADWEHLRMSLSAALNLSLSGAPMFGIDVGGTNHDPSAELFTRWLQAACLLPTFRSHVGMNAPSREPWTYGQPYEVINRLTIQLRYQLLPYLYSAIAQCREYGHPIIRPLFMAEPHNQALRSVADCYMLGDALLVAPVVEPGAIHREVYLPTGIWYDFWTNEPLQGGKRITVTAPLERLPLFVRAGAVLPFYPEMQYVGEKLIDTLVLRAYPGDFETVLYEDAGEGFEFEQGDYRWIYIACGWDDSQFILKRRIAGRFTPQYKTIKLEIIGFDEEPIEVRVNRHSAPLWFYDDGLIEINADESLTQVEITRPLTPSDKTIIRRPW